MKKSTLILIAAFVFFFELLTLSSAAQYTKLLDFDGALKGKSPNASLFYDGTYLYGTTGVGGIGVCGGTPGNGCGVLFKIKPDGTGFTKMIDFSSGSFTGAGAMGTIISDGIYLYGTTFSSVFKIKPDGTGFVDLYTIGTAVNDGSLDYGSLISDGTFLYSMTAYGGAITSSSCTMGCGTIFKIKPDGTSYTKLHDFDFPSGSNPYNGSLILVGSSLYGMTSNGGANGGSYGDGVIFKINQDGTGYTVVRDFSGLTDGQWPQGSLIYDGTFLYGMTGNGGANNLGTIFKIMPDGSGYVKLYDFLSSPDGNQPGGDLLLDGTFLYGMTAAGGTGTSCGSYGCGTIFKIKTDGTGYAKLMDFTGTVNGDSPFGALIKDGNILYGTTYSGGINDKGTVFKFDLTTTGISGNSSEIMFDIYPNPGNGMFTITTKENNYTLLITNVLGEMVYQDKANNQKSEFDLSSQPEGMYFITIKSEKGTYSKKMVVSR